MRYRFFLFEDSEIWNVLFSIVRTTMVAIFCSIFRRVSIFTVIQYRNNACLILIWNKIFIGKFLEKKKKIHVYIATLFLTDLLYMKSHDTWRRGQIYSVSGIKCVAAHSEISDVLLSMLSARWWSLLPSFLVIKIFSVKSQINLLQMLLIFKERR